MEIKGKQEEQKHDEKEETLSETGLEKVNGGKIHFELQKEKPGWIRQKQL